MKLYELLQVSGYTDPTRHFLIDVLEKPVYPQDAEDYHRIEVNLPNIIKYCNYNVISICADEAGWLDVIIEE